MLGSTKGDICRDIVQKHAQFIYGLSVNEAPQQMKDGSSRDDRSLTETFDPFFDFRDSIALTVHSEPVFLPSCKFVDTQLANTRYLFYSTNESSIVDERLS